MRFWSELKRRNVVRMAILYIVSGWLILQMADLLFDLMGIPEWALRMVLVILILGLPVAIVFSWLYELTPEGLKRESEVPREVSITDRTGRKLNALTLAVGLLAIGLVSYQQFLSSEGPTPATDTPESERAAVPTQPDAPPSASIAVLPFVNLSGSEENEYFSDGLTETLLHGLAKIPDLKVAARTSSFAFKGKDSDIREIAGALGVGHVLEGSVQRSGDRVRITAQLIRASDGFHVWTENFDRTLDDIFAIQDEIAGEVGRALSGSLLGLEAGQTDLVDAGTANLTAYDLYLRALSETAENSYGSLQEAEQLLKQALAEDPGFVDAKIQLADVYELQASTGLITDVESRAKRTALLEQVIDVRPGDIRARSALVVLGAISAFQSGRLDVIPELTEQLRRLIEESPSNTEPRSSLASVYRGSGQEDKALAEYLKLIELDPLNPRFHYQIADTYHDLEDWKAADRAMKRSLELEPRQPSAESRLAHYATHLGDAVGYLEHNIRAMELDPQDHELPSGLAIFLYQFGLIEQGDWFLARAESIAPTSPTVRHAQMQRAMGIGNDDAAVEIARGMIRDDLDNRHGSEATAFRVLFRNAILTDRVEEALAFVEEHRPGFRALDDSTVPFDARTPRIAGLAALSATLRRDEFLRHMDDLFETFASIGWDFSSLPLVRIQAQALRGDTDGAIGTALEELFAQPATRFRNWDMVFDMPYLAEVSADPAVAAAIEKRRADEARLAEEMRRYFAEHTDFGVPT